MTAYAEFLASKRRVVHDAGRPSDPAEVHPSLFDFQRDIVLWALRKGRASEFAQRLAVRVDSLAWERVT